MSSLETIDLGWVYFRKNTPEGHTGPNKMNDLEQPMLSYYVIYFEKFRKVMQWTEKEVLTYYSVFTYCRMGL